MTKKAALIARLKEAPLKPPFVNPYWPPGVVPRSANAPEKEGYQCEYPIERSATWCGELAFLQLDMDSLLPSHREECRAFLAPGLFPNFVCPEHSPIRTE